MPVFFLSHVIKETAAMFDLTNRGIEQMGWDDLERLVATDPLAVIILIALSVALSTWALSVCTDNYSYMDRLWPILPVVYAWIITCIYFIFLRIGQVLFLEF